MSEIWKDIYFIENNIEWDYRGKYQVSSHGRIKSLNYNNTNEEKIMIPTINKNGYYRITLSYKSSKKTFKVHRLVAHMFCSGYFDGAEVDHINRNRIDNHIENLRWCTKKENMNNRNYVKTN